METSALVGSLKRLAVLGALCACCNVGSAGAGEISLNFKSGWFTWEEKVNGSSFVKQRGAMLDAGIARTNLLAGLSSAESAEVWGGDLDYDGHDLTGSTKIDSDTSFLGTKEEVALEVKLPAGKSVSLKPFLGIGHKFWIRTRSGEDGHTFYAKAGLTGELQAGGCTLYLKGGALLPIYTRTHTSLSSAGYSDVVTVPKSRTSAFAEAGVTRGAFTLSVEYEQMRFGQSDKVPTNRLDSNPGTVIQNSQAFQPDSQSSLLSLNFAYSF